MALAAAKFGQLLHQIGLVLSRQDGNMEAGRGPLLAVTGDALALAVEGLLHHLLLIDAVAIGTLQHLQHRLRHTGLHTTAQPQRGPAEHHTQ